MTDIGSENAWMTAAAAAQRLGVTRATLYAYVSRGLVRSQPVPGSHRERAYAREDVDRLRRRADEHRHPDKAAARSLQWGLPVLESAITLIDGAHLYYRGHDAVRLAQTRPVHEAASLLWTGGFDARPKPSATARPAPAVPASGPFVARAHTLLAHAAAADAGAFDTQPAAVVRCGWRILQLLTTAAAGVPARADGEPVDRRLARAWRVPAAKGDLLRAALILCADHELNVSSFTARCVASTGATPYAVVAAGLAALEGPRHGGASGRAEAMLAALRGDSHPGRAIAARLRRGERLDGFGHPLYPQGDPRAAALLGWLRDTRGGAGEHAFLSSVVRAAANATGERPNLDFALAALATALRLPPGAPLVLFAIGRSMGWIAHALEQYATGQLIRPRAKYVGPPPP
jgi:citrate synthase